MALKDWRKLGPDKYETISWPYDCVFIGPSFRILRVRPEEKEEKPYHIFHDVPSSSKLLDHISAHRTKKAAHAALMKYIRTHDTFIKK